MASGSSVALSFVEKPAQVLPVWGEEGPAGPASTRSSKARVASKEGDRDKRRRTRGEET